ncbi:RING-type domain-containing protein [Chloropicon primus]|uniref:RING-type domain-containing protein n=2 Tax=Chloropicon primus TaxID=1764295 RepID=A0A5B8MGF6_9CHLO|nr:hypothetical protein A3770_03p22660 [Chloropicon primus]UPQ98959.1 RING-type domain-containing protein [Chloropicon primus]|eukprot:QDZ19748.1 hypothetical protein A3770_03p22660 [Chloropicon primus]
MSDSSGAPEGTTVGTGGGGGGGGLSDIGIWCHACQRQRVCTRASGSEAGEEGQHLACPVCGSDFVEEWSPAPAPRGVTRAFTVAVPLRVPGTAQQPAGPRATGPVQGGEAPRAAVPGEEQQPPTSSALPALSAGRLNFLQPISVRVETRGHIPPQLLESLLGQLPGSIDGGSDRFGGSLGDYVFHNEALERVMAQLAANHAVARQPASADAVAKLPRIRDMEELGKLTGEKCCSICQDDWCTGELDGEEEGGFVAVKMPCSHVFHEDCLLQWLKEHNTCPICRLKLASAAEGEEEGAAGLGAGAGGETALATVATGEGEQDRPLHDEASLEMLREMMNDIDDEPPGSGSGSVASGASAGDSGRAGTGEGSGGVVPRRRVELRAARAGPSWIGKGFVLKKISVLGNAVKWVVRPLGRVIQFLRGGGRRT